MTVVTSQWLYTLWKVSLDVFDPEKVTSDAKSADFCAKFRLPTFHNLFICVTGLNMEIRKEMEECVSKNGIHV